MKMDNEMIDEFFEWLNNCPVQWFLISSDDYTMKYSFDVEAEKEDLCLCGQCQIRNPKEGTSLR